MREREKETAEESKETNKREEKYGQKLEKER